MGMGSRHFPRDIWYVSYGSNLSRERLMCYIEGGQPAGSTRKSRGCHDRTPPSEDRAIGIPHALTFAFASTVWGGGGVAVLRGPGSSIGRAYKLSTEQFRDVVAQENGGPPPPDEMLAQAIDDGSSPIATAGTYDLMISLPDIDGTPALTFTSSLIDQPPNKPSIHYLRMIARGLAETADFDTTAAANYFLSVPGGDEWDRHALVAGLRSLAMP
jgi:hypothetical protein